MVWAVQAPKEAAVGGGTICEMDFGMAKDGSKTDRFIMDLLLSMSGSRIPNEMLEIMPVVECIINALASATGDIPAILSHLLVSNLDEHIRQALSVDTVDALQLLVAVILRIGFEGSKAREIMCNFSEELLCRLRSLDRDRRGGIFVMDSSVATVSAEFILSFRRSSSDDPLEKAKDALQTFVIDASSESNIPASALAREAGRIEAEMVRVLRMLILDSASDKKPLQLKLRACTTQIRNGILGRDSHAQSVGNAVCRLLNSLVSFVIQRSPTFSDDPPFCQLVKSMLKMPNLRVNHSQEIKTLTVRLQESFLPVIASPRLQAGRENVVRSLLQLTDK
jgi:hypothetical protein